MASRHGVSCGLHVLYSLFGFLVCWLSGVWGLLMAALVFRICWVLGPWILVMCVSAVAECVV
jgi:hypothetical protein